MFYETELLYSYFNISPTNNIDNPRQQTIKPTEAEIIKHPIKRTTVDEPETENQANKTTYQSKYSRSIKIN